VLISTNHKKQFFYEQGQKINMVLVGVVDRAQTQYQTEPETEPQRETETAHHRLKRIQTFR
jgi:hypothetical protein